VNLEGKEVPNMSKITSSAPQLTHWLLGIVAVGVWGLLLRPYLPLPLADAKASSVQASAAFDTLTVQRINVVDASGKPRLIIANSARFPGGMTNGKNHPRSIGDTAGLLFLDPKGNEMGGLVSAKLRENDIAGFTFDFTHQQTDGIRMWKEESTDGGRWRAGFDIFDRRPYTGGAFESTQGVQRITLVDENQNAQLLVSDPQGRPRIRIGVDSKGTPIIAMLDEAGKTVYRAGQ
jgi:hypothetical protein